MTPPRPPPPVDNEMHMTIAGSLVYGCVHQFVKGIYRGEWGMASAKQAVGMKALRTGGKLAVYLTLCPAFESTLAKLRGKDDFWNPAIAITSITKKGSTFGLVSLKFITMGIVAVPICWGCYKFFPKKTST